MKTIARKLMSFACSAAMLTTMIQVPLAAADDFEITSDNCYMEGYEVNVNISTEGTVLLKNNGILPLKEGTGVTIVNGQSFNYVLGGAGSGGGNDDENTVSMYDAFEEVGLDVNDTAWEWLKTQCGGSRGNNKALPGADDSADDEFGSFGGGYGNAAGSWTGYTTINEYEKSVYDDAKSSLVQEGYSDYAVVTFSRSGAEASSLIMDWDGDGSTVTGTTYLELSDNEKDVLKFCKENFAHTIVLINTSSQMELGFIDSEEYNVDACLWIGHPGEAGIVGVGSILVGQASPSGRLADTWAYDLTTNPTFYNDDNNEYANANGQKFYQYEEGIYVGYRFYETADAEGYFDSDYFTSHAWKNGSAVGYDQVVQFPFGYGLSYTSFTQEITESDVTLTAHGSNSVTVKVTNVGDTAGKQVVELYMEAPYAVDTESFGIKGRGLEKAKVVLVGYGKTSELAPGASEEVKISFNTDDLASYDNFGQGCYVLESGAYSFNVQTDAHQWGERAEDSVKVELPVSYVYKDETSASNAEAVGKRDGDASVAVNALDDVTAGDGCMLDGYLSRSDFAAGMAVIMAHESDEEPNERLSANAEAALATRGTDTYTYSFDTYRNGVKTNMTETLYAQGSNMMPFGEETPDGKVVAQMEEPVFGAVYYVVEGQTTESGYPVVTEEEPAGAFHKLSVNDLKGLDMDTEEGFALLEKLANEVTLAEAIELQGNSGWSVPAIASVQKPKTISYDGPAEVGGLKGATWFASASVVAATWNRDIAYAEGVAYGHQDILAGISEAYGPAMDTHRTPFGGRNFEYYSEDGLLAGNQGGSEISGIRSTGIGVFVKHFALNEGDTNRQGVSTWANEQAIREIYLLPFEISCKEYGADGIMGSMNRIGLTWMHYGMYNTIIRDQWGWKGYLITDGEGATGDAYNSCVAMLSVGGSMLTTMSYVNAAATIAAYGDASETLYGRVMLHNIAVYALYQYIQ